MNTDINIHQDNPSTSQVPATADQIVEALQSVVGDVDTFLSSWFGRLQQELKEAEENATTPSAVLRKRLQDFQEERSQWEAKRQSELQEIENKANQLTEAWLRLEDEQRSLLQMKEGGQRQTSRERAPASDVEPHSVLSGRAPSTDNSSETTGAATVTAQYTSIGSVPSGTQSRDAAIRQFQRLRREVESTRPK